MDITLGMSTRRTMKASIKMAAANASPKSLIVSLGMGTKAMKTELMINAAATTTRPDPARP